MKRTITSSDKLSVLDDNLQQVLRHHTVDEVIVFLEMMLAKDKIERSLGIKKKPGRPAKNTGHKN